MQQGTPVQLVPQPFHHISQIQQKVVRVKENAHELYAADERWDQAHSTEKDFALRLLQEIIGRECRVMMTDSDPTLGITFYHIQIDPKVVMPDPDGISRPFGMAFIPADYCEIVHSGFMEAR